MSFRADPANLDALAGELSDSTDTLTRSQPAPEADAGPSGPAVAATIAELMRAAAGLAETTSTTAEDVHASSAAYASTDGVNADRIDQIQPR